MPFLWECYIWDDRVGFRQKPTKPVGGSRQKPIKTPHLFSESSTWKIDAAINRIKTVGACKTVLSLGKHK